MSKLYPVNPSFAAAARLRHDDYTRLYAESVNDPEGFWGRIGQRLDWIKPPTKIKDVSFDPKDLHIRWYEDGELNVSANCLDRQLATRGDKVAIIFEGDDPKESRKITYRELHAEVCKFANTLKHLGVVKGDRVAIYLRCRCWRAPGSARSTRWCSAVSRPTRWPGASPTPPPRW